MNGRGKKKSQSILISLKRIKNQSKCKGIKWPKNIKIGNFGMCMTMKRNLILKNQFPIIEVLKLFNCTKSSRKYFSYNEELKQSLLFAWTLYIFQMYLSSSVI